ncbi:hypothetical protein SRHO_G00231820 [Serrasalmus rhombeus]
MTNEVTIKDTHTSLPLIRTPQTNSEVVKAVREMRPLPVGLSTGCLANIAAMRVIHPLHQCPGQSNEPEDLSLGGLPGEMA